MFSTFKQSSKLFFNSPPIVLAQDAFLPSQLSVMSAWLRNDTLTGNISSVTDVLNLNPAVQGVDDRRPSGDTDGSMTFLTNDVLSWPLDASNNGGTRWGCAAWFELDAPGATNQTLGVITLITGGASARKINIVKNTADRLTVDVYINDTDGRRFSTTDTTFTTAPVFVTVEIDTSKSPEANQVKITLNGDVQTWSASNLGSGGSLTSLVIPTGNMLIGNGRDSAANAPFQGRMGRNWYQFGSTMPNVTHGLLTPTAITNLMNFERLV